MRSSCRVDLTDFVDCALAHTSAPRHTGQTCTYKAARCLDGKGSSAIRRGNAGNDRPTIICDAGIISNSPPTMHVPGSARASRQPRVAVGENYVACRAGGRPGQSGQIILRGTLDGPATQISNLASDKKMLSVHSRAIGTSSSPPVTCLTTQYRIARFCLRAPRGRNSASTYDSAQTHVPAPRHSALSMSKTMHMIRTHSLSTRSLRNSPARPR